MKNILACEGPSEVCLIKSLICFGHTLAVDNIFLDEPIVARQIHKYLPLINAMDVSEDINILRIGDTQNEEFSRKELETRDDHIRVLKYCTKPELEILVIINEGLFDRFCKCSSKIRPKQFVKRNVKDFNIDNYFLKNDMFEALNKYKMLKKHKKDELFLIDLFIN